MGYFPVIFQWKPFISLEVSAVAMHGKPVCAGVVITGGAAGVGFAYADEFLARGHQAGFTTACRGEKIYEYI